MNHVTGRHTSNVAGRQPIRPMHIDQISGLSEAGSVSRLSNSVELFDCPRAGKGSLLEHDLGLCTIQPVRQPMWRCFHSDKGRPKDQWTLFKPQNAAGKPGEDHRGREVGYAKSKSIHSIIKSLV